jgi:hypothetical protein
MNSSKNSSLNLTLEKCHSIDHKFFNSIIYFFIHLFLNRIKLKNVIKILLFKNKRNPYISLVNYRSKILANVLLHRNFFNSRWLKNKLKK